VQSQQGLTVADQRARTLLDGEQAISELWALDEGRARQEQASTPVDAPSDTSLSPDCRTGQAKQITDLTSGMRQQNCAANASGLAGLVRRERGRVPAGAPRSPVRSGLFAQPLPRSFQSG
jgi:hypothetical protein